MKAFLLNQGIKNFRTIPDFTHREWPFWVHKQYHPSSASFSSNGPYFSLMNTHYRHWAVLSDAFTDDSLIVDPTGLIHINGKPFSIDFWISNSDNLLTSSKKEQLSQTFNPESGSITTSFSLSQIHVSSEVFFRKLPEKSHLGMCLYTLKNMTQKRVKLSFYVSIRPYTIEGITPVHHIQYLQSNAFLVNRDLAVILDKSPDNVVSLPFQDGDVCEHFKSLESIFNATCSQKKASAFAEYRVVLDPDQSISFEIKIPSSSSPFNPSFLNKTFSQQRIKSALNDWQNFSFKNETKQRLFELKSLLKKTCSWTLPDQGTSQFLNTQQCLLYFSTGTKGFNKGIYQSFFPSYLDHLLLFKSLCQLGFNPELFSKFFSDRYFNDVLDTLNQRHFQFSELGFLFKTIQCLSESGVFPLTEQRFKRLQKIAFKALKKRRYCATFSTKLAPKRICSKTGINAYFLSDNLGLLALLRSFRCLASQFSNSRTLSSLETIEQELIQSIHVFCSTLSTKVSLKPIIPVSDVQMVCVDSVSTLLEYLALFPEMTKAVTNTVSTIQAQLIEQSLVFSYLNPSGFPLRDNIAFIRLLQKINPQAAYPQFTLLLSKAPTPFGFPDAIHPATNGGSDGDGHNCVHAAALVDVFFSFVCLRYEKSLQFFKGLPDTWLLSHSFEISSILTEFGSVGLSVSQESETKTAVTLSFKKQSPCDSFMFDLPASFSAVEINGKTLSLSESNLKLPAKSCTLLFSKHGG